MTCALSPRLLGEVGIWFRFTADTRLHIDVAEFCDSQQGYEKGLTLPSVPPSGQQSAGVDAVWEMACRHRVVEQQVEYPRLQLPRGDGGHERAGGCHPRETTTFGEAYHWGDNYLTAGMPMTAIRRRSPGRFTPGFGMSVI